MERLLVKGKKPDQLEEIDGDPYGYFLLAGQTHPYPDDTFYSVGRVPRKLLMKYLGIKGFHANIHGLSKIVSILISKQAIPAMAAIDIGACWCRCTW